MVSPPRRYSLFTRVCAVMLSILITLGGLELLLRAYVLVSIATKPEPADSAVIRDLPGSPRVYGLTPDLPPPVRTNDHGFRGEAVAVSKPPGVRRIVMLGDSITFGNGVAWNQTFSWILQENLNRAASGRSYEVLNLGVTGYNTAQELATLRELGLQFSPDLIVLNVCLNDSDGILSLTNLGLKNDTTIRHLGDVNFRTIVQSSYLMTSIKSAIVAILQKYLPEVARWLNSPGLFIDPRVRERRWVDMKEQMRAIFDLARAHEIPIAMVIYPYSSQIGLPPEQLKPQQDLLAFAASNGIPALETSAAYRNQREAMFADGTLHLSAHGHRVMAEQLAEFLAGHRLLGEHPEPAS